MRKVKSYALAAITGIAFWILVFGYVFGATVPTTGYIVSSNCATITSPGVNQISCLQTTTTGGRTAGQLYGWNGSAWYALSGAGSAAPVDATYLTQTPNSTLTNEQAMSALSTGIVKNTTATGVQSIAASGVDYAPATSGSAILKGNGSGGFSSASAGTDYAAAPTGTANTPLFNNGSGGFTNGTRSGNTTEVVTATGTLTSGDCAQWDANGNVVASGGPCASGSGITQLTGDVTAGPGSGSQAATIANAAVTLAKIQNAAASSKLLGSGASGSGASYSEITLGTNLSMSGTTLNASGGSSNVWTPMGPSALQTAPPTASWSWDNQSTATVTEPTAYNSNQLSITGASSGLNIRYRATPSTPYTITALLVLNGNQGVNFLRTGLALRESSSGKLRLIGIRTDGNTIVTSSYTNSTTFSADINSVTINARNALNYIWFQISDDGSGTGTARQLSYSWDGINFFTLTSESRTTFITPDGIGWWGQTENGASFYINLASWIQS
jgi:uncharacterized protein DUF5907